MRWWFDVSYSNTTLSGFSLIKFPIFLSLNVTKAGTADITIDITIGILMTNPEGVTLEN